MTKPKVLISDALSPAAVQIFKDRGIEVDFQPNLGKDKDKLAALIGEFDGLAVRSATKVTPKILEQGARLKVIGRAGIGVDNVDIPAATAKGIIVMNTPFGNSITTAEHAITLMLALARQIPQADASTQAGKWEKNRFMGVEITGKTLGVIGCGNIGSIVADRAVGLRNFARQRQHQSDGMFGGRDRIAERRVHHDDAPRRRRRNIDVVDADAGAADHFELCRLLQDFRRDLGGGAHRKAVELADHRGKLVLVLAEIGLEVDLDAAVLEDLDRRRRQGIGDEHAGSHGIARRFALNRETAPP